MLKKLRHYKKYLTPQQYRTIKGQILSGDIEGSKKGINKLCNQKEVKNNVKNNGEAVGTARD